MDRTRRHFLAGTAALAGAALLERPLLAMVQAPDDRVFTPEMFGARGDGRTNDSRAMAALAAAVNRNGGGTIVFRPATYIVGEQRPAGRDDAPYTFDPLPLLEIEGCRQPLIVRGNGARLKCADGLRYGVFDARGRPLAPPMPYIGPGLATPYRYLIRVAGCTGPVEISDLELDGNLGGLLIGGRYGDTGWQIPATGLALVDNAGAELVRNLHSHHHGQDGLLIDGLSEAPRGAGRRLTHVRCEHNGRQGCSIVGGRDYVFERCRFAHTGRAGLASAPGAGVDIEAEGGKSVRAIGFADCEFADNVGAGLVADSGPSEGASFRRCTFLGTTNWSAWPNKPYFTFDECRFTGALCRAFGDPDPARAAQFRGCLFDDDPALSPTGQVYAGENPDGPLADLSDARNVLFSRCRFVARTGALPWSIAAIYADCRMEQSSPNPGYPRGTYTGRNVIDGHVDLYGSVIAGELILNGRRIPPTRG